MINVVLWLGKTKHSDDLAIIFARNNIRIVDEHFDNNDDFIDRFDVILISWFRFNKLSP